MYERVKMIILRWVLNYTSVAVNSGFTDPRNAKEKRATFWEESSRTRHVGWPNTLCGYRSCRTHTYEKRSVIVRALHNARPISTKRSVGGNWGIDRWIRENGGNRG